MMFPEVGWGGAWETEFCCVIRLFLIGFSSTEGNWTLISATFQEPPLCSIYAARCLVHPTQCSWGVAPCWDLGTVHLSVQLFWAVSRYQADAALQPQSPETYLYTGISDFTLIAGRSLTSHLSMWSSSSTSDTETIAVSSTLCCLPGKEMGVTSDSAHFLFSWFRYLR